jgi:hypothetical protein
MTALRLTNYAVEQLHELLRHLVRLGERVRRNQSCARCETRQDDGVQRPSLVPFHHHCGPQPHEADWPKRYRRRRRIATVNRLLRPVFLF